MNIERTQTTLRNISSDLGNIYECISMYMRINLTEQYKNAHP